MSDKMKSIRFNLRSLEEKLNNPLVSDKTRERTINRIKYLKKKVTDEIALEKAHQLKETQEENKITLSDPIVAQSSSDQLKDSQSYQMLSEKSLRSTQ